MCHLANISYRLGEDVPFTQKPVALGDNPQVLETVGRIEENLKVVLGMKLEEHKYRLGAKLDFDASAEKFVGNDKANELLTRPYRKPFVVPEQV